MPNIGYRIKSKREEIGLTQLELAKRIGYSNKSTIAKIEKGENDIPQRRISDFARALDTTEAYLLGFDINIDKPVTIESDTVAIPVLGEVAAGIPIYASENIIGYEDIPRKVAENDEYFALKIKGDSMSPRICEGDVVIVKRQSTADSGDIVIAIINGDTGTCKRLLKYNHGISLLSFNPAYEPMDFSNQQIEELPVNVIGKVVENRQKY